MLDSQRNDACQPDGDIAADGSAGRILVLSTREDVMMLREVERVLSEDSYR